MDKLTLVGKVVFRCPKFIKDWLEKIVFVDVKEELPDTNSSNPTIALVPGGCTGRPERAAELYRRGIVSKILLSGGTGPYTPARIKAEAISEAQFDRLILLEHGVKDDDIWLEENAVNTMENMEFSVPIIARRFENVNQRCNVVIVTNHFHIRRTAFNFNRVVRELEKVTGNSGLYTKLNVYWSAAKCDNLEHYNWRYTRKGCANIGKEAIRLIQCRIFGKG